MLAQMGAALLLLLLLPSTRDRARRFALHGAFMLVAGVVSEGGTRVLSRPLSFGVGPVLAALALASAAALIAWIAATEIKMPGRISMLALGGVTGGTAILLRVPTVAISLPEWFTQSHVPLVVVSVFCLLFGAICSLPYSLLKIDFSGVLGMLSLGFLTASGGPSLPDTATVVTGAAAALLPLLGLVLVVRKRISKSALAFPEILVTLCVALLGLVGLLRTRAVYDLTETSSPAFNQGALLALSAAVLAGALAALPRQVSASRHSVRILAFPVAAILLASASPSLAVIDRDPREGLPRVENAVEADIRIVQGMTAEIGAGPRTKYRGKDFYDCDRLNSRDCFITHYDDIALKQGVAAAVADVVEKVKSNKGATFPSHCHQVVHNLGQMAYLLASDFSDAAVIDPQVCGTGYTHGLWEQQFEVIGVDAMFARTGSLCQELNMVSDWYKWTCHHILGHMMAAKMANDPTTAVEYCTKVEDAQGLTDCLTGGWMNFFQDDVVIARMRADGNPRNVFAICYGAPQSTKFFCYQELFPVIYSMIEGDDFVAGQLCLDMAEPSRGTGFPWTVSAQNYADRCIQGLARGIAASSNQNYILMRERCLSMPKSAHDPCLTATAASYVLNTGGAKTAFEVCKFVVDDAYREYCYFWTKHARALLANGPNNQNLPGEDEVRLPERTDYAPIPGFVYNRSLDEGNTIESPPVSSPVVSVPRPSPDR